MGNWVYSWIVDHWGVNIAGILLILFVVLYLYAETFGSFSFARRNPTKSANNNCEPNVKSSLPEITTTLTFLKSSEKR
jgi:hypothetical protein